jgi:hypothetical protein
MLSKVNSFGLLAVMAIALLLLVCFASSVVYADGAGGQSPEPPPEDLGGSGDPGGTSFTDVLGILLSFII